VQRNSAVKRNHLYDSMQYALQAHGKSVQYARAAEDAPMSKLSRKTLGVGHPGLASISQSGGRRHSPTEDYAWQGKQQKKHKVSCSKPCSRCCTCGNSQGAGKCSKSYQEHWRRHSLSTLWATLAEYLFRHSRSKSIGIHSINCDALRTSRALKHLPSQAQEEQVHDGSASFH
jgi:hypothetical protein